MSEKPQAMMKKLKLRKDLLIAEKFLKFSSIMIRYEPAL